jgi:hypothetical protein
MRYVRHIFGVPFALESKFYISVLIPENDKLDILWEVELVGCNYYACL